MQPPVISTVIEIGLVPVAVLFIHAFWSGLKGKKSHRWVGLSAIIADLGLSAAYMIFRSLGGAVEGQSLHPQGALLVYFIVHGSIAAVVMGLELWTLAAGLIYGLRGRMPPHHKVVARILFPLWLVTFITGESAYLFLYVFH